MTRLTATDARVILERCGISRDADYFTLSSSQVNALVEEARRCGYRKPKNANGSRGRYFFQYLIRLDASR